MHSHERITAGATNRWRFCQTDVVCVRAGYWRGLHVSQVLAGFARRMFLATCVLTRWRQWLQSVWFAG